MAGSPQISRRALLASVVALGVASVFRLGRAEGAGQHLVSKLIPSTRESIPIVGLGSWITFNVGNDIRSLEACTGVVRAFFEAGGRLIDSSPMYGSSQSTIGFALDRLGKPQQLFSADKVWTSSGSEGPDQIENSHQHWGVSTFDLLQVHNLLSWERHLPTLFAMKAEGALGYVGVTTSHGRRHRELLRIIESQPIDFIQVTYNAADRDVEDHVLPAALEKGVAVIANRPFQGGRLIRRVKQEMLPNWAADAGCNNWAEFLLKFIASHPAMTCAIPATTREDHVRENMGACSGHLPNTAQRSRMADYIRNL